MTLAVRLTNSLVKAQIWMDEHRALVTIALVALPVLAALALALLTHSPAYACIPDSSSSTGCKPA